MARNATAKPQRRGSSLWLLGLACGALATLATSTTLLAGVLLIPTVLVAALDRTPGKPVARAVLLYGLAGLALPLMDLWNGGRSMEQGWGLVTDPMVVATAWAAQAAGWLLAELAPLVVRILLDLKAVAQTAKLRSERTALAADWDPAE